MKHQAKGAPRAADGRFKNNFRNDPHGGAPMWKFLRDMRTQKWTRPRFQRAENDPVWLANNRTESSLTWIGHASFLIQAGGLNILTDPVFSHRVSPVQWAGPARIAPLGLHMHELPRIDAVLISHNHYDHLGAARPTAIAVFGVVSYSKPAACVSISQVTPATARTSNRLASISLPSISR